jgi:hypothetical protein
MHENFLLGSPFKFIYFCSGGVGQSAYNLRVNDTACTLHAVSLTPYAFLIFFAKQTLFAYDFPFSKLFENFTVHAMSMTPHASCKRFYLHRMHFEYLREFEFICKKALAPKSGVQDGCFNEKIRGSKIS